MPKRRTTDEDQGVDISFTSIDVLVSFYFKEILQFVTGFAWKSIWFYRLCVITIIAWLIVPVSYILYLWGSIIYNDYQSNKVITTVVRRRGDEE